MKHIQRFEAFLTEGKETFKKGEKLTIDMGDGPEEVEVMDDFNAGLSQVKFISLKRKKGAPYTITTSKLMKIIVEHTSTDVNEAEVLTVIDKGDKEREIRIIVSPGYVTLTQKDFDGNVLRFIVNNDQINEVVKALNKVK